MDMANCDLATGTHVKVLAHRAAEALAGFYLGTALVARGYKCRGIGIVQMVQHHHAAVLCAAHGVKLVMVALA